MLLSHMAERLPPGARRDLAEYLQGARKAKKLTQAQAGDVLGVDHSQISKWESGENTPRPDRAAAIAELYDLREEAVLMFITLAIDEERLELKRENSELTTKIDEAAARFDEAADRMEKLLHDYRSALGDPQAL